jgi:hypothetical protein
MPHLHADLAETLQYFDDVRAQLQPVAAELRPA